MCVRAVFRHQQVVFLLLQVHDDLRQQHQLLQRRFLVAVQRPIFLLHTKTQGVTARRGRGTQSEGSVEAETDLGGLVHLDDHGADHVIGVADERASVTVTPPLAVHGFPPGEHEVKVRHEAHTEGRDTHTLNLFTMETFGL